MLFQSEALPVIKPYKEDLPNSIQVACASNHGELLDGHFGTCLRFLIYQVNATESRLIEIRTIDESGSKLDKNSYRASLLEGCQILFIVSIGGPGAAKVVRAGVHPIKKPQLGSAKDEVDALQQVISNNPPPWLAKVMGQSVQQRIRFKRHASTQQANT